VRYFAERPPLHVALALTLPLFLLYQVGVLLVPTASGADLVTAALMRLVRGSLPAYLGALGGLAAMLIVVVAVRRRNKGMGPAMLVPVLLESGIYALTMGTLILFVMARVLGFPLPLLAGHAMGALEKVVLSLGAGFHEELLFRLALFGGMAAAGTRWLGLGPVGAGLLAGVLSSALFALAHHVGPMGDPLRADLLTYRFLAGGFFAALFRWRGFAIAAYTHALYDLYVLLLR
jgi:CAAX prenyl protease-like protein